MRISRCTHSLAICLASRAEDQQKFVVEPDRLVNLNVVPLAALHVLRRTRPEVSLECHPGVQTLGEIMDLGVVADEAGVELDRFDRTDPRRIGDDQCIGYTTAAEKSFGDLSF